MNNIFTIKRIYLLLILGNTLAASFIWGINTIFLLNAGLSNFQAFLANAFFSLGQVLFEIPTGVVADMFGRRISYMLGTITLAASTLLYLWMWQIHGPFWAWALSSMLLGLGFTFFSGALEAWLVDALKATKYKGSLENVFADGQVVGGAAMLVGSFVGGVIAQFTNLGVPYILRAAVLILNFLTAFWLMKDLGFKKKKTSQMSYEIKGIFLNSIENGFKNPPVRWMMITSPLITGVSFYVFYALQPFLLKLYGDEKAYTIAGLVAMLAALAQICGGIFALKIRSFFKKRTTAMFTGILIASMLLVLVSFSANFWVALVLIFLWGLIFAAISPIRQAYINAIIPSEQRATILSFDSLMGSLGGVFIQPTLGRVADLSGYAGSYFVSAIFQALALPFIFLSKRTKVKADNIEN